MNETPSISVVHLDDDENILEVTRRSLQSAHDDLDVRTTTSSEEALGMLSTVDCIITDYVMHGMDGLVFLEAVREVDPELPVIFFTGRGSEEVASEAFELGVTDYLRKGVGGQQYSLLGNRVKALVERHRAQRAAAQVTDQINRIYDRIGEAFLSVGREWEVRYVNSAAEAMLVTGEEFESGTSFWTLLPEAEDRGRAELEAAMADRTSVFFDCYVSGLDRWLEIRAYPSPEGLSVYCRDVTDEPNVIQSTGGQYTPVPSSGGEPERPPRNV